MTLTEKQKMFADYNISSANATDSYMKAYKCKNVKTAEANSSRLLRNDKVKQYVAQRNEEIGNARIADMQEVQEFWADTLRDIEVDRKDRLKASELIAKTKGAFLDKLEVTEKHIIVDIEEDDNE